MRLRDDRRGQAIQIGAVLLFGILIISFSTYQAFVVPNQNEEIEFNHNQRVQGQMQEVRNAIVSIPGGGTGRSVSVDLGVRYPSRLAALNPGPPSGTIRTERTTNGSYNLSIQNADTSPSESDEVGDVWNGTARNFTTGSLVYAPDYNLYSEAPTTVYENSVLYNEFRDNTNNITGQQLIDGKRLTLVTLNGSLGTSRSDRISLDVQSASSSTTSVSVWNRSENIRLELPTRLSTDDWQGLVGDKEHVTNVDVDENALDGEYGLLQIELERDVNYTLRMARVGVGGGVREPEFRYVTDVEGNGSSVTQGNTQKLVVEARDEYNNPLSDVPVRLNKTASDITSNDLDQSTKTTGTDGRATFLYTASGNGWKDIVFNASDDATEMDREKVTFKVNVEQPGTGSTSPSGELRYNEDAEAYDGPDYYSAPGGVNFSITNDYGQDVTVTDINIAPQSNNIDTLTDVYGDNEPPGPGRNELYVDGDVSNGYNDINDGITLPGSIDIDSDGFLNNANPVVSSDGGQMKFYLYEFYGFGSTNVDMSDEPVDITLSYTFPGGGTGADTFTVTPGADGVSNQALQPVGSVGDEVDTAGDQLIFDIENTGDSLVTVEEFSIDVTDIATNVQINDKKGEEFEIQGSTTPGSANAEGNGKSFAADGTSYDLEDEGGTYAEIGPDDDSVTIDFRYFEYDKNSPADLGSLEITDSAADADVTVTLVLSNGDKQRFFFKQT